MTRLLGIVLAIELLVAVAFGQMGHVYSPATARAWWEWRQHPTPENLQAFEQEKRIAESFRWGVSGVAFALMAGVTVLISRARSKKDNPPNGNPPAKPEHTTAF